MPDALSFTDSQLADLAGNSSVGSITAALLASIILAWRPSTEERRSVDAS